MTGRPTNTFSISRGAIAGYAGLMLLSASLCAGRLVHASASPSANPTATAAANNMASPQLIDRLDFAANIFALRCQMTLAHIYFDWLAPMSKSLAVLAALPGHVAAAVLSLNPLGLTMPVTLIGKSQYLLFW